jgi:hypothetical protein
MKFLPSFFLLDCKKKKKKEKKKRKKHHKHHDCFTYNQEKDESVNSNKKLSDVQINMDNGIDNNEQYNTNISK